MPPLVSPKTPHRPRADIATESPNYFGLVVDSDASTVRSVGAGTTYHLAAPSASEVHPHAKISPRLVPLQSEPGSNASHLQSSRSGSSSTMNGTVNKSRPKLKSQQSSSDKRDPSDQNSAPPVSPPVPKLPANVEPRSKMDIPPQPRSPKRLLSSDSANITTQGRRLSPAQMNARDSARSLGSPPSRADEKHPRLSLPGDSAKIPSSLQHHRAETLPAALDPTTPALASSQHVMNILDASHEEVLLLDLRVSTQYARSRIVGALNLCIPTTLLKRASYNVEKLADTFKDEGQRAKFEKWRSSKYLIVYDNASSQVKEANNCVNILKKFASEGWNGESCIIKGGFQDFSQKFPKSIDSTPPDGSMPASSSLKVDSENQEIPPVVGGCPIPAAATKNVANPFFGNIRQNMDLIGGVGQMAVNLPPHMNKQSQYDLPKWLREASDERDNGKTVSDKFLGIEKREQKRMQEALSSKPLTPTASHKKVEIAGLEKGEKNRYNNIWPYEHSRVKLKNVPKDGCDYVNANFLKSSLSKRSYIATQGPIPSTFADFWSMVWQRDIRVIVMLTAETEGGQVKAHNYWDKKSYGPIQLHHHSESQASLEPSKMHRHRRPEPVQRRSSHLDQVSRNANEPSQKKDASRPPAPEQPFVHVRKFTISHSQHPFERMREVTQLQYSNWPDFGAPAHPAHLLGLVEHCNSVKGSLPASSPQEGAATRPPFERPILVHCSAGCGRTGTFCTVDTVVDVLKRQRQTMSRASRARHASPMDIDGDVSNKHFSADINDTRRKSSQYSPVLSPRERGQKESELRQADESEVDLVEKVVEEFRLQRLSMVQSLRQFVLCYETVLEWIAEQEQPKTA